MFLIYYDYISVVLLIHLFRCPDNCSLRKTGSLLGLEFGSRSGLVLGLGATRPLPLKKIVPRLELRFELRLVLGLGGNCPRTICFYNDI